MGKLEFTGLEVMLLGSGYASAIGRFRLARSAEGGGDASGLFTLLLRRTPQGWKIILDHTS
jgi:ketosteroid isomerase-like protein